MIDFDLIAKKQAEHERVRRREVIENGENIYWNFRVWCNAYKNGVGKDDARVFAEYIKKNGIELTHRQRKWIAENCFGFVFTYNHDKGDWDITKKE